MASNKPKPGFDSRGKFAKGNKVAVGYGNPQIKKLAAYQAAVREAVTPEDLREVFDTLLLLAKSGDLMAARELLNRCLGKATTAPRANEGVRIDLPTLAKTSDAVDAANAIMAALGDGRLSPDDAVKLTTVVELARRALETHDLSVRLARLEEERGIE